MDEKQQKQAIQKQAIIDTFDQVADGYESPALRFFVFSADRLAELLHPEPGQKVLDIATGTGLVASAIGQRLGPSGRVHAIDLSPKMLEQAAANLAKTGVDNVDLHQMDAEALEFKSRYFDIITCAYGLFFIDDILSALKGWRRVLKTGGRLMFTSFTDNAFKPINELFVAHMQIFGVELPPLRWQRLAAAEDCQTLMQDAGFNNIEIHTEQMGYHLQSADEWWEIIWNSGYRLPLSRLNPEEQVRFRQQHLAEIEALRGDKGIWLDVETHFVLGQNEQIDGVEQ